jgi:hemolysin activation/secretion protein
VKRGVGIILALLVVSTARAQFDAGAEAFRRQEQREALERERIESRPDVQLPRPERVTPETVPDESPCFDVTRVDVAGAEGPLAFLGAAAARYAGRCLGVQGINAVVAALQDMLIRRGYVTTRVVVPEQDLSRGTLALTAVPGLMGDVWLAEPRARATLSNVFTTPRGALLDLRDLEQGLEQMQRLPSQNVQLDIVPGAEPGESDIVVRRESGNPVRAMVGIDDSGQTVTGRYQAAATLAIDGPFGLNDLFYVAHNQAVDTAGGTRGSAGTNAYYSIPYGWWTYSLGAATFDFKQTITGAAQTFTSTGDTQTYEARIARVVHRSEVARTTLQFRVQLRESANYLDDVEILAQRRKLTAAELAVQHRQRFGTTVLDAAFGYRQGVSWFGAQDPAPDPGPDTPDPRYRMLTWDVSVGVPLRVAGTSMRYFGAFRGQYTRDALFSQDFFSIGNRYTVRGFDGQRTLASDRGWLVRNEVAAPVPVPGHEVYAGIDYGHVSGVSTQQLAGRHLTGAVLGFRGGLRGWLYEAFMGWALWRPDWFPSSTPTYGFQLLYAF